MSTRTKKVKTSAKRRPAPAVEMANRLGVPPHSFRERIRSLRRQGRLSIAHRRGQRWEFRARDLRVLRAAYAG